MTTTAVATRNRSEPAIYQRLRNQVPATTLVFDDEEASVADIVESAHNAEPVQATLTNTDQ